MNKLKKPCKCGHRAGKHTFSKKKILHNPFKSGRQTMPYKERKHVGYCTVEGCTCRAFKEQDRKPVLATQ